MKNNMIKSEMDVKGSKINVVRISDYEYISLPANYTISGFIGKHKKK